jgi:cell wall-associated NlpC family hydrolase
MRRLLLVSLAVSLAAVLASSVSLFVFTANSQAGPSSDSSPSQGSLVEGPALPEEDFPPYSQIVDNASPGHFKAPGWEAASSNPAGYGKDYRVAEPSKKAKPALFKVKIPATDVYSVYAWWPAEGGNNPAARFGISTTSGVKWTEVDQRVDGGFWVKFGQYEMEAGESYAVQVSPGSEEQGRVVADAVAVVRGVLSSPPEESYEEPTSGDATFSASRGRVTGRDVVRVARGHKGTRYRLSPPHPCRAYRKEDCSCHTKVVFRRFDKRLPDSPRYQWRYGKRIAKSNRRPGDLIFFDENRNGKLEHWDHVGIYSGNGYIVHGSSYYGKVVESKMKYIRGFWGVKRLRLR